MKFDETLCKENGIISFHEKETYYDTFGPQGGEEWLNLRVGRITMSQISACVGRSGFTADKEFEARKICGLEKIKCNEYMFHGKVTEPMIRDWYAAMINRPIKEMGVSIWKKDFRFGGSLDGVIDEREGIEIKAPAKMYQKLIDYIEAKKKGYTFEAGYHEHVFNSHYDQMTGYGVITNKKFMHYVVVCTDTQEAFVQKFPVDYQLWETELYPKACKFYEDYVEPMMVKNGIKRIDPY